LHSASVDNQLPNSNDAGIRLKISNRLKRLRP
jgi:hypothetical protein